MKHFLEITLFSLICLVLCTSGLQAVDTDYRQEVLLNGEWKLQKPVKSNEIPDATKEAAKGFSSPDFDASKWDTVTVPHNWHKDYPDTFPDPKTARHMFKFVGKESTYVSGWYAKTFDIPQDWTGKRVYLRFASVAWSSHLWVNGTKVKDHKGSFTPFEVDITEQAKFGAKNELRMFVYNDFGEFPPRHAYGKMFFATSNEGGVQGEVSLIACQSVNIRRTLITPKNSGEVDLVAHVRNTEKTTVKAKAELTFTPRIHGKPSEKIVLDAGSVSIKPGHASVALKARIAQPHLWDIDNPWLYDVQITLKNETGKVIEKYTDTFGFREFVTVGDKFMLNGKRVRFYGGNILTVGPWDRFVPGGDFHKDIQRQKKEGANCIRYHMGGADSHKLLRLCDEEGMFVMDEFPLFHRVFHVLTAKGERRKEFMDNVLYEWRMKLLSDYNHPSAVLWSLSNEVWTDSCVDELNELYANLKPLDKQNRPMSAGSGPHSFGIPTIPLKTDFWDTHLYDISSKIPPSMGPTDFDRLFDDVKSIYGKLDRPMIAFESMLVGYGRPKTKIPFEKEISVDKYLELLEKNKARELKWVGLRRYLEHKDYGKETLNKIVKDGTEQFRIETRLQGFHGWYNKRSFLPSVYKNITQPFFVGLQLPSLNLFAGNKNIRVLSVVKDSLKSFDVNLRSEIVDGNNVLASIPAIKLNLPENQDRKKIHYEINVPATLKTGQYELVLYLEENGKTLNVNRYPAYVLNSGDMAKLEETGTVGVIGSADSGLTGILRKSGVQVTKLNALPKDGKLTHLILQSDDEQSLNTVINNGGFIKKWVMEGGRLLISEVDGKTFPLNWICEGYKITNDEDPTPAVLMEPVLRRHPIFSGLSESALSLWLGDYGVLASQGIVPLSNNMVAAAFPYHTNDAVALVMEAKFGKGQLLISLPRASKRYGKDSAATKYANNLLDYFLKAKTFADVKEFAPASISGDLEAKLREIESADCHPVDLSAYVNRSVRDETAGDGKGGWMDEGASDLRHCPTGKLSFAGIPFYIIPGKTEDDRSCIALKGAKLATLPEKVSGIKINSKCERIFFLHTAYYLKNGRTLAEYTVNYTDGTSTTIPVIGGDDIGDWYSPFNLSNAIVAWKKSHPVLSSAQFGFYLMAWENPSPEKTVSSIDLSSTGISNPVVFGITVQNSQEYSAQILGKNWLDMKDFTDKKIAVKMTGQGRDAVFTMLKGHGWFSPKLADAKLDANKWCRLQANFTSSKPVTLKIIYMSKDGHNGTSAALKPVSKENGKYSYDVRLDKIDWQQGSNPDAKQWGGPEKNLFMFALDFYGEGGTELRFSKLRLTSK